MAANLLVRRSTAGLLRLVRSQAATFFTGWRPRPSDSDSDQRLKTSNVAVAKKAISGLEKYCKKYNLVTDTRSIDEILDNDKGFQKFLLHIERSTASACLWSYWTSLMGFGEQMIRILFWEHLLKHSSHAKIQMDAALKLKEAFSPRDKDLKDWLLKENEREKKQMRRFFEDDIRGVVMREIEKDIMKMYQENRAKWYPDGKSTKINGVAIKKKKKKGCEDFEKLDHQHE